MSQEQETVVRSQKSGGRSQEAEVRRQKVQPANFDAEANFGMEV